MAQVKEAQVPWNEDELILVCQLQQEAGWQNLSSKDPAVIELSGLLRSMRSVGDASKVRNPNSIILKAWDLHSYHPQYVGAAHKGSKLDQAVMYIFLSNPQKGATKATAIRAAHKAVQALCPHCSEERHPDLIARNYLCAACQDRATDVLGWNVKLFLGMNAADGLVAPIGAVAKHADGTPCAEVTTRVRAYVDGSAYRVVEGRFGGVFLKPLPSTDPPSNEVDPGAEDLEKFWKLVAASVADEVQWLKDGDFLTINYETGDPDYALYGQLAPEEGKFHVEVVSNEFMPADDWPLDAEYLQSEGWLPPDGDTPNWFRKDISAESAAYALLSAMRQGRGCQDPRRFRWSPATFPSNDDD